MFFEQDGACSDWPLYMRGSGFLCTINGRIALITARHCVMHSVLNPGNVEKKVLTTNLEIGIENKWVLFKDISWVKDINAAPGFVGGECDLALAITTDIDNVKSNDAIPVIVGDMLLFDSDDVIGNEYFCYGYPDISGSTINERTIFLNPVEIILKSTVVCAHKITCVINGIVDRAGKCYSVNSALNGLSGSPVFRRRESGVVFSGIAVMAANGILHFIKSTYVLGFIQQLKVTLGISHAK